MGIEDKLLTTKQTAPDDTAPSTIADQETPRSPADRGGALPPVEKNEDEVEEASEESFPASDPPSYPRIT